MRWINWRMVRLRQTLTVLLVAVIALVIIGAVGLWTGVHNIAPRTSLSDLVGLIHPGQDSLTSKIEHDQRINVLLMARGGAGSDNPNFTDTMLILCIRPRSRQATLVSLPRFLIAPIPALSGGAVPGRLYTALDRKSTRLNSSH